ncbi:hypothetical protein LR48_Vigan03g094800 [Vigna angularis]|uniref:Uncharacterized protein n=1 Tax=Phaseolus angularis TaxID=3914 RepID=A0A0L9U465_PHAAN|nr:hypothetical protein LR48_Vigan03g094800 [Vigna angularis]
MTRTRGGSSSYRGESSSQMKEKTYCSSYRRRDAAESNPWRCQLCDMEEVDFEESRRAIVELLGVDGGRAGAELHAAQGCHVSKCHAQCPDRRALRHDAADGTQRPEWGVQVPDLRKEWCSAPWMGHPGARNANQMGLNALTRAPRRGNCKANGAKHPWRGAQA